MKTKKDSEHHLLEIYGLEITDKHAIADQFGEHFSQVWENIQQVYKTHKDQFQKKKFFYYR